MGMRREFLLLLIVFVSIIGIYSLANSEFDAKITYVNDVKFPFYIILQIDSSEKHDYVIDVVHESGNTVYSEEFECEGVCEKKIEFKKDILLGKYKVYVNWVSGDKIEEKVLNFSINSIPTNSFTLEMKDVYFVKDSVLRVSGKIYSNNSNKYVLVLENKDEEEVNKSTLDCSSEVCDFDILVKSNILLGKYYLYVSSPQGSAKRSFMVKLANMNKIPGHVNEAKFNISGVKVMFSKKNRQGYDFGLEKNGDYLYFTDELPNKIKKIEVHKDIHYATDLLYVNADISNPVLVVLRKNVNKVTSILTCDNFTNGICLSGWRNANVRFFQNETHVWFYVNHFSAYIGNGTAGGYLKFVEPTPYNNELIIDNWTIVNVSYDGNLNISSFIDFDNDLIGYWNFEGATSTTVYDYSVYGNNGTFLGGAATNNINEIRGNYGTFDGVDDYIDCGDINEIDGAKELTVSVWVKLDDLTRDMDIVAKDLHGNNAEFLLWRDEAGYYSGRTDTFSVLVSDGVTDARIEGASGIANDNDWHNIVVTFKANDPSGLRMFVDGVEDPNSGVSTVGINALESNTNPFYIGNSISNTYFFDGNIDEVMVFNKTLTPDEIKALYNGRINKLERKFEGLSLGNHTFRACGIDVFGNYNCTEYRKVVVVTPVLISGCANLLNDTYYLLTSDIINDNNNCFRVLGANVVLDCAGHIVDGDDDLNGNGFMSIFSNRDNVFIKNCRIQQFYTGINFRNSNGFHVRNVSVVDNTGVGVYLDNDDNVTFYNFTVSYNSGDGIQIYSLTKGTLFQRGSISGNGDDGLQVSYYSSGSSFDDVTISGNTDTGAYFYYLSGDNIFKNISVIGNNNGIYLDFYSGNNSFSDFLINNSRGDGIHIEEYSGGNKFYEGKVLNATHSIELYDFSGNNTFSNLFLKARNTIVYLHSNVSNNSFYNVTAVNSLAYYGFYIGYDSGDNYFSLVNSSNNYDNGIYITQNSGNNVFNYVKCYNNRGDGIHIEYNSPNNRFSNVVLINNSDGVELYYHVENNSFINVFSSNRGSGFYLHNNVSDNLFKNVTAILSVNYNGIWIGYDSWNNTFVGLNASGNDDYGIYIRTRSGINKFYNSTIYNNGYDGIQIYDNSSNNVFENLLFRNNSNGIYLNTNVRNNTFRNLFLSLNRYNGIIIRTNSGNNVFKNVTVMNSVTGDGIHIDTYSGNNSFTDVYSYGNGNGGGDYGFEFSTYTNNNSFYNVTSEANYDVNFYFNNWCGDNSFVNTRAIGSLYGGGFYIWRNSSNNYFLNVSAINNGNDGGDEGVEIYADCSNNTIVNYLAKGNGGYGINIHTDSPNNFIDNVTVVGSVYGGGITIRGYSSNNTIQNGKVMNVGDNDYGFYLGYYSWNNTIKNFLIVNTSNDGVHIDTWGVDNFLYNISIFNVSYGDGIEIGVNSSNNYIDHIYERNNYATSVYIHDDSENNTIVNSFFLDSLYGSGVHIRGYSGNNFLKNLTILNNGNNDYGININYYSPNNFISNVYVENHSYDNIHIEAYSWNNTIINSKIINSSDNGIEIYNWCYNNTLINLSLKKNRNYQIYVHRNTSNNTIVNVSLYDSPRGGGVLIDSDSPNNYIENITFRNGGYSAYQHGVAITTRSPNNYVKNVDVYNVSGDGLRIVTYSYNNYIENIKVNWSRFGNGIYIDNNCGNNSLFNIDINNVSVDGLHIEQNSHRNIVKNLKMNLIGQEGLQFQYNVSHNDVENVSITNARGSLVACGTSVAYNSSCPWSNFSNIYCYNSSTGSGFRISYSPNNIYQNITISTVGNGWGDYGFNIQTRSDNNTIENLRISNTYSSGFRLYSNVSNNKIVNLSVENTVSGYGVEINIDCDNNWVKNLFVKNSSGTGLQILNSHNNTFINVYSGYARGLGSDGINVGGSDNDYQFFDNGTLIYNGDMGAAFSGASHVRFFNFNVSHNGDDGFYWYINGIDLWLENLSIIDNLGHGIYLSRGAYNSTIRNVFIRNATGGNGVQVELNSTGLVMENVTVVNTTGSCFYVTGVNHNYSVFRDIFGAECNAYGFNIDYATGSVFENVFINKTSLYDGFEIYRTNYSSFENVTVLNAASYGVEFDESHYSNMSNLFIYNSRGNGFESDYIGDVEIVNLTVLNGSDDGINIYSPKECVFEKFVSEGNADIGIVISYWGNYTIKNWSAKHNGLRGLFLNNCGNVTIQYSDFRDNGLYNLYLYNTPDVFVSLCYLDNASKVYSSNWGLYSEWNVSGLRYPLGNYWNDLMCTLSMPDIYEGHEFITCVIENYTVNAVNNRIDYGPLVMDPGFINISFVPPTPESGNVLCEDCIFVNVSEGGSLERSSYIDWNKSLVGYWNFDAYNGSTLYDLSNHSNNGTLIGVVVDGSSKIRGKYGVFDGVSSYVDLGSSSRYNSLNNITIEAWIKKGPAIGWNKVVAVGVPGTSGYSLGFNGDQLVLTRYGILDFFTGYYINDSKWHYIVGILNTSGMFVYVDGNLVASNSVGTDLVPTTTDFGYIGRESTGSYFKGDIDEVRIVKRVLSEEEIRAGYLSNVNRLYANFTDLPEGNYTVQACNVNYLGNRSCTEVRTISYINISPDVVIHSPVNATKYFEGYVLYANISSDVNLTDVYYFLDGNESNSVSMFLNGSFNWVRKIENLSFGYHNITFVYNSTCGKEYLYGGWFYYIHNVSQSVSKRVYFMSDRKYNVSLKVDNYLFNKSLSVFDFVPYNFSYGNFSLPYNDSYAFNGWISGEYLEWNMNLSGGTSKGWNYVLYGDNDSSVGDAFVIGWG